MVKAVLLATLVSSGLAQMRFDVASIKPSNPDARGGFARVFPGGRVEVSNYTLKHVMVWAWRVQPFQISGGPGWIDSIRYDISAKPASEANYKDAQVMLQALLADRFKLAVHRETKDLSIYALVVRKDGKLGPQLVESTPGNCTPGDPTKPGQATPRSCGSMVMGASQFTGVAIKIANLTPMLSRLLGRTVIDQTGLAQPFDVTLQWTPDVGQTTQDPSPSSEPGPSIFTALQEQLGLRLEAQKGPVEILVIDRVEKPTEN